MANKFQLLMAGILLSGQLGLMPMAARAETVYQGNVCSTRVNSLTSQIDWLTDLKSAEQQAREQNKLVFWMHMLGKIDGAT